MRATVVVPTFNAAPRIRDVLAAVLSQQAAFAWNVLVIDSGSRDATPSIVEDFAERHSGRVSLHRIPNREFGHGRTRNLAAQLSDGEFVVFLSHDAVPARERWLEHLIEPFQLGERIACVYGKQLPWPDTCPTVKRDIVEAFCRFGGDDRISVQQRGDDGGDAETFFSDVNAAIRRSVLLGPVPFRDLRYAEDQAFGKDVIDAGYAKAYTPFAAVYHSHNPSPLAYYRRIYDELVGLRAAVGQPVPGSPARAVNWIATSILRDWRFVLGDADYSTTDKVRWLLEVPLYNLARGLATRASATERLPRWLSRISSLEADLRRAAS